ncbi:hypothetical protein Goklo_025373 [Gossypium klotzschianum]|uniref:Uncharacterized protein n=1 Tax=Gossypium klotzschianum TaxID=34286 RepID=A0A7J8W4G9_9ROSI|nr:hypothetical protein [Gossypium klotzschianum]
MKQHIYVCMEKIYWKKLLVSPPLI